MKIAYFDCFAGISGDMTLGALIHAGADANELKVQLSSLKLDEYELEVERVRRNGIAAANVNVHLKHHHHGHHPHHHRGLAEILDMIDNSGLSPQVKERSSSIFKRLAQAEASVHGTTIEDIHFHEVGAVDAIVDIVGASICLDMLGIEKVVSSPLPTFHGFVKCAHGVFPLPAPATMELIRGVPTRPMDVEGELVTPTGAAIITTLASQFGPMPPMQTEVIGYGSGKKDFGFPNLLRVMIGEADEKEHGHQVTLLETNIDDLNPQFYELLMERLFAAGAFDVYLTPIQMKKNRSANLVSVLCNPDDSQEMLDIIFANSSTLGVRISEFRRVCLEREWTEVDTSFGKIRIKIGKQNGTIRNIQPEYEDCKAAAIKHNVPIKTVHDEALFAFNSR